MVTDGTDARQAPEDTAERRITWWQRALRWMAWLTFLGLAVWKSDSVYFSPMEWLAPISAIAISIWCLAKPLGRPKYELRESAHLLGAFVSRTSWGLVLFGAILTIGGAYALFLLLLPGVLLLWFNLIPFCNRGTEFQVHPDGSVSVRTGDSWEPLIEYQYATVTADGTTIGFTPPPDGPPAIVLPQYRVFSRQYGARLDSKISAEFFRRLLAGRGFAIEGQPTGSSFTARRQ